MSSDSVIKQNRLHHAKEKPHLKPQSLVIICNLTSKAFSLDYPFRMSTGGGTQMVSWRENTLHTPSLPGQASNAFWYHSRAAWYSFNSQWQCAFRAMAFTREGDGGPKVLSSAPFVGVSVAHRTNRQPYRYTSYRNFPLLGYYGTCLSIIVPLNQRGFPQLKVTGLFFKLKEVKLKNTMVQHVKLFNGTLCLTNYFQCSNFILL